MTRIYYTYILLKKQSCSHSFFERDGSGFDTIEKRGENNATAGAKTNPATTDDARPRAAVTGP